MEKKQMEISLVKKTNSLSKNKDWYYTELDGDFVSDSGSFDFEEAKNKFDIIVANGGVLVTKQIIEKITIE